MAVILAGVLCGFAGAYLSTAQGAGFVREMSAGKGFIALAAMVLGGWRPLGALAACLLFGFLEAGAARLQGVDLPLIGLLGSELLLVLPYIATVSVARRLFRPRHRSPRARAALREGAFMTAAPGPLGRSIKRAD